MAHIQQVPIQPRSIDRFEPLVGREIVDEVRRKAGLVSGRLDGHVVWNVNSTASGGGVAEMLASLLGYPRAFGIDVRWAVIEGTPEFFTVTKRLHHALQGSEGDGSSLGDAQREIYHRVSKENADELLGVISTGDVVILHDPQTAGLAPALMSKGCLVIWRCHIGDDRMNSEAERGWAFLAPYLKEVPLSIFSRYTYIPPRLNRRQTVIAPSIDPFSAKCDALDDATVRAILEHTGLVEGERRERPVQFVATDGTPHQVDRRATVVSLDGPPPWEAPLLLQVSRWDPLKDPVGVIDAFSRMAQKETQADAHLMLVGPEVSGVADDPESGAVVESVLDHWQALRTELRRRVHVALLPTADSTENAFMVNALQGHARIVVQKSLREGFGLTVTEAMWQGRPIVASKVGGIQDQMDDHVEGILVDDPHDLDAVATAFEALLSDEALASRLGNAARARVVKEFLPTRHLLQYADLIESSMPPAA